MLLFFVILLSFVTAPLQAAADDPLQAAWELKGRYHQDPGGALTLDTAMALAPEAWTPVPPKGLNLGFTREPHWFRLPLPPCKAHEKLVFDIGYPLLDRIDFWFRDPRARVPS